MQIASTVLQALRYKRCSYSSVLKVSIVYETQEMNATSIKHCNSELTLYRRELQNNVLFSGLKFLSVLFLSLFIVLTAHCF